MLKSPLFYSKFLKTTIDLTQLAEVSDAELGRSNRNWETSFTYRYAQSDAIKFTRRATVIHREYGDKREPTAEELANLSNESVFVRVKDDFEYRLITTDGLVLDNSGLYSPKAMDEVRHKIRCLVNLQAEVEELRATWAKWKEIEPLIYAQIRAHLS